MYFDGECLVHEQEIKKTKMTLEVGISLKEDKKRAELIDKIIAEDEKSEVQNRALGTPVRSD